MGTAFISHDPTAGLWTIGSADVSLTLALDPSRDFEVVRLASAAGQPWTIGTAPDTVVRVGGQTTPFGNRAGGFTYQNVTTVGQGPHRSARCDVRPGQVPLADDAALRRDRATRRRSKSGRPLPSLSGVVECGGSERCSPDGAGWHDALGQRPAGRRRERTTATPRSHCSSGTCGLARDSHSARLAVRPSKPFRGSRLTASSEEFYAGLMWSGAWSLGATRSSAGIDLTLGLARDVDELSARRSTARTRSSAWLEAACAEASAALRTVRDSRRARRAAR